MLSSWLATLVDEGSFIVLDVEVEGGLLSLRRLVGVSVFFVVFSLFVVLCPTRRGKNERGWWE